MWHPADYAPSDLPAMVEMAREFYGDSWISNPQFLDWQYHQNPAGQALVTLAKSDETDELVGQYIIIPMDLKVGTTTLKATLSLNTLTKKAFWGKGIFTKLASLVFQQCAERGLAFTYGFPNPNSYPGFMKKLAFKDLGKVPLLIRPLDIRALAKAKLGGFACFALPFQPFFRPGKQHEPSIVELNPENLADLDAFWSQVQHKYRILGIRDTAHLKWRYFDIPLREYRVLAARNQQGELEGYIVGRCTDVEGMTSGMIVDFLVKPGARKAGDRLIKAMLAHFGEAGMALSGALMLDHTEEFRLLKRHGFLRCPTFLEPQPFPVIYRKHGERTDVDETPPLRDWFLTMGDYDVI